MEKYYNRIVSLIHNSINAPYKSYYDIIWIFLFSLFLFSTYSTLEILFVDVTLLMRCTNLKIITKSVHIQSTIIIEVHILVTFHIKKVYLKFGISTRCWHIEMLQARKSLSGYDIRERNWYLPVNILFFRSTIGNINPTSFWSSSFFLIRYLKFRFISHLVRRFLNT